MSTREAIQALTAEFAQLVRNKDFSAIGAYYDDQARLLLPGSPMIEGRAAIQAAQQELIESGVVALDLQAVDVIEAGDFVIEIGHITVTIQPPGVMALIPLLMGKRKLMKQAKSVVVWRRQKDGTFKIAVDIFNSNSGHF